MNQSTKWNNTIKNELDQDLIGVVKAMKSEAPDQATSDKVTDNLLRTIMTRGQNAEVVEKSPKTENTHWQSRLSHFVATYLIQRPLRLAATTGTALAIALSFIFISAPTNLAFASVQSQLQKVDSMYYVGHMKSRGVALMDLKVHYRQPSQVRIETSTFARKSGSDNAQSSVENSQKKRGQTISINILDVNQGKGITLFPNSKMAVPFSFDTNEPKDSIQHDPIQWYQTIKNYQGEPTDLGLKVIDGVEAHGFVINDSGSNITIWASSDTSLPIKLHVVLDKINGVIPFELVADLKFNEIYDDAFFSLDVGDEYQLQSGNNAD